MVIEYAQMLCTAHRVLDGSQIQVLDWNTGRSRKVWVHPWYDSLLYRATHVMHPSSIWVRESSEHYRYLWDLMRELNSEYRFRYQRDRDHASFARLSHILHEAPLNIADAGFCEPPQSMPLHLKSESAVDGYKNFYISEKISFATYKRRVAPEWFKPFLDERQR